MHTDDDDEYDLPIWNLSTNYDEENEKKDPIDPDKPSPSDESQIDPDLPSHISAVAIVVKTALVFPSAKYPFTLS